MLLSLLCCSDCMSSIACGPRDIVDITSVEHHVFFTFRTRPVLDPADKGASGSQWTQPSSQGNPTAAHLGDYKSVSMGLGHLSWSPQRHRDRRHFMLC
ncbi:hypothetical protein BS50DRAFT_191185 [Corynespora cassiicola Philippines]|uniref:Uncharacterized protein n=1 Tax=Corynespora cassiicola Philippines TaxID=1448308 RepID=A0A2T2P7D9_CORCC|nr:hypothetical protein BS50DRAFT_191185 [Corynespora cassiicola Philippines]